MSLFELRQWWESLLPWWTPFLVPVLSIAIFFLWMVFSFLQHMYDSHKAKKRFNKLRQFSKKDEQNSQNGLTKKPD